ncbi:MAG: hypothetical protein OEO79_07840 [Gemmatimonadota bacterium]|nr:hypothetical protein [Gemmatimonadota bacterium]MDH3421462.1 hypothetical protein [Gemmatimonadota bacterium]
MSSSRTLIGFGAVGCVLALTACASLAQTSADPFDEGAPGYDAPVMVTIENNDFRDATVYGMWSGVRDRLGMVTGKTTRTFSTEWRSESFSFYVNFVGGGEYRSESIEVWSGDHLNFVIMASPGL